MTKTVEERAVEQTSAWNDQAEEALKTADVAALRQLVNEAAANNVKLAKAFDGMISVYAHKGDGESESAIAAMRDVALAAIELCKARTA